MEDSLNSKEYWDQRFASGDWESKFGRDQSRFFARIAVENLPEWFKHHIIANRLGICDWGCAEGDGTDILASHFGREQIQGVDFSRFAIQKAQQYYPELIFKFEDWLTMEAPDHPPYDVIFSSNTLEHFSNPLAIFQTIAAYAKQIVALIVPFEEYERVAEHQHTFLAQNIKVVPISDFVLIHAKIIDTTSFSPNYWNGEQVLLIYLRAEWASKIGFPLNQIYLDLRLSQALRKKDEAEKTLSAQLAEREQVVQTLSAQLSEREQVVQMLSVQLAEREQAVQTLTAQQAEREQAVQTLTAQLTEREQAVQTLTAQLTEREQAVQTLTAQLTEREQAVQTLTAQLTEREQAVQTLTAQLTEREQAVQTLTAQLTEREQAVQTLTAQLTEREQAVQKLSAQLAEREQTVQTLTARLAEREQAVQVLTAQMAEKEMLLRSIYASRAFRLVTIWWAFRNGISRLLSNVHVILVRISKKLIKLILPRVAKNFIQEFRKEYIHVDKSQVILFSSNSTILATYSHRRLISPHLSKENTVQVSLISTVKNEAVNASEWLNSLILQTRKPDEVVIVDGGSTDGTLDIIREFAKSSSIPIRVIEAPGSNISQGRNIAIQNSSYSVIASTDFGCILDRDWLRFLVTPFEMDGKVEVSAGYYQILGRNSRDQITAKYFVADLSSINPCSFLPSSRSVAFMRTSWAKTGGYPEWLTDAAEDTLFDIELKRCGGFWAFVPEAKVYWRMSRSLPKIFRTVYRYAKGDGEVGLFATNYWLKAKAVLGASFLFIICILFLTLSLFVSLWILIPTLVITGGVFAVLWHNMTRSHPDAKIQELRRNVIISTLVIIAQVLGFTLGVANRQMVQKRQSEQYVERLRQIIAHYPNAKGIVIYPPTHDWGFMFQRPHQMARAFAMQGYLYFFCTNNEKTDAIIGFQEVEPALYVCYVPLETFSGLSEPIVYIGSPWHRSGLRVFNHPRIIYDHYDDLKVSSANLDDHMELLHAAKVVVVTSQRLLENVREHRPDAVLIPNGVDYKRIQQSRPSNDENIPLDLEVVLAKGHPIVGYSGALAEWFDYELLSSVAKRRPDLEFVLIGANYDGSLDQSEILGLQNVHWLGMKTYNELFKYLWHYDIGIIPFKINNITLSTSPIKLFEYMAFGKPVITTALPECKRYNSVFVAETCEQFFDCLDKALSVRGNQEYLSVIDKIARENTWDIRVAEVITALELQSQGNPQKAVEKTLEDAPINSARIKIPTSPKSQALNLSLYSDVQSISTTEMQQFVEDMRTFCRQRNYSQEYTEAWMLHRFRLIMTFKWLVSIVPSQVGDNFIGLELGGESIVTDLLTRYFPQARWQNVPTDIRLSWPITNQSIDLISCTEVLEHLSDLPKGLQESFEKTGLIATLKECYRVLKPGGYLFLTTPNAASVVQMINILAGKAPWYYSLHVREYTAEELLTELKSLGFEVKRWCAVHCLSVDQVIDYSPIFQVLLDHCLPTANRGDDIFLIASKPIS